MNILKKLYKPIIGLIVITLIYNLVVNVLNLPVYVAFIVYLVVILTVVFMFRKEVYAVWGNFALMRGNSGVAEIRLKKAINMGSKSPVAHLNYSILKLREGDWETSLQCLEKASKLSPNIITDKNIYLTQGSSYWVKGDLKKAIEVLEELRSKYEYVNCNVLTTLSYMYFLDGQIDVASEITDLAIEDDPTSSAAWDNLGQIQYKLRNIEKAKEAFLKALELKETLVDSLYFMGEIYELENNDEMAKQYFEKANCSNITALNTVKKSQIESKLEKYS